MIEDLRIYRPHSRDKDSLVKVLQQMIADLFFSRELVWRLFLRDFKARYKQAIFGWGWALFLPIVAVGTFLALNLAGAIKIEGIDAPYPIYGLLGISLWQIFAGGLSAATGSILSAGPFVVKINFSKEALVVASVGQALVEFFIRMILLLVIFLFYGLLPSWGIFLFPILILPLLLFSLGLGFVTSLVNAVARDTQSFINMTLGFLLFLMPIMYTVPQSSLLFKVNQYNPLFYLITFPREMIIFGSSPNLAGYLISSLIALVILVLGWFIFYKARTKIAEAV